MNDPTPLPDWLIWLALFCVLAGGVGLAVVAAWWHGYRAGQADTYADVDAWGRRCERTAR